MKKISILVFLLLCVPAMYGMDCCRKADVALSASSIDEDGREIALIADVRATLLLLFEVRLRINLNSWLDESIRQNNTQCIGGFVRPSCGYGEIDFVYNYSAIEALYTIHDPFAYYVLENLSTCLLLPRSGHNLRDLALVCLEMMQMLECMGSFVSFEKHEFDLLDAFQGRQYEDYNELYLEQKDCFDECEKKIKVIIARNSMVGADGRLKSNKTLNELRNLAKEPMKKMYKKNKKIQEALIFGSDKSQELLTYENIRCMNNMALKVLNGLVSIVFRQSGSKWDIKNTHVACGIIYHEFPHIGIERFIKFHTLFAEKLAAGDDIIEKNESGYFIVDPEIFAAF